MSDEQILCAWRDCDGYAQLHPTERLFLSHFCEIHKEKSDDINRAWAYVELFIKKLKEESDFRSDILKMTQKLLDEKLS